MAIYRGDGGAGDATNDITINQITELSSEAQISADAAASSATSASSSASAATTSATNAANSATSAGTSATNAASSASSASTSASNASTSETNAAASETAAAASEASAALSETAASTSETNAASSASSASTSASTATTQATSAATSATNAATSASAASTSETNAATSETNAATSETNAASSATSASTDAATATTKASEASTSASNAATSETNAAASESAAATSATNASTSETNAAASETAAASSASASSTSATNASTSETNAATSASSASTSASAASTSATAAATSATNAETAYDNFDDRYLGAKSSAPTLDNDGDALITGALYFDTTDNTMYVYTGSAWIATYASDKLSNVVEDTTPQLGGDLDLNSSDITGTGNINITGTVTSDRLTIDTDTLHVDATNNRVGIGTSSPSNKLGLGLTSGATTRLLGEYGYNESPTFEMGVGQTDSFRGGMRIAVTDTGASVVGDSVVSFHTTKDGVGTVERVTIDEDGNVGIGTTSPDVSLQVNGGIRARGGAPGALGVNNNGYAFSGNSGDVDGGMFSSADGQIEFYTNSAERMRIDSSGNVGIGTSNPANNLEIQHGANSQLRLSDTLGNGFELRAGTNFIIKDDGTERMRIDSSGKVGIGASTVDSALHIEVTNPLVTLEDSTNALKATVNGENGNLVLSADTANASGSASYIGFEVDTSEAMRITSSGGVSFGSSGTAYGTSGQVLTSNGNAAPSWQNASGGAGTLEAWVNFNGTGTVAIREDGNVSSITDNGTGRYQINFSTALTDTNYAVCGLAGRSISNNNVVGLGGSPQNVSMLTTSCRIITTNIGGTASDMDYITVAVFR